MPEGALKWETPEERSEEEIQKETEENATAASPELLKQYSREDQVGFIRHLFESKDSAEHVYAALSALQKAVGLEERDRIIAEAVTQIKEEVEEEESVES